jgi:hypothetical protein
MSLPTIQVYSRQGCHLCELLIDELLPLIRGVATIDVRDVDSRDDWRDTYDVRVPVVEYGDELVCEGRLEPEKIRSLIERLAPGARS